MSETIYYECPDCHNTEFEIIKELSESKPYFDRKNGSCEYTSGYYRCECTVCGFVTAVKSKNPMWCEDDIIRKYEEKEELIRLRRERAKKGR